ncbi:alpha-E domain-containing protein [Halalkalibacillus sediminis]|uniref:alpha-E domain-containing protein n=1 Tax=Halalkalibacillus sediminis TaxID=2018042 RepID=UPI001EE45EDA|nr:alpha-E domain-containing protein [Halalkalibacillus sediminis]
MLSRVADSLYWMAKNIERAENNSRILSTRLIDMLEADDTKALAYKDWEEIIDICSSYEDYVLNNEKLEPSSIVQYLTFDQNNMNSLQQILRIARDNAKSTREIIPTELWEHLNDCYWNSKDVDSTDWTLKDVDNLLKQLIQSSFTTQGIIESSLLRGDSYTFLQIGKCLERAEKTSRILTMMCEKLKEDAIDQDETFYYHSLRTLHFVNGHQAFLKKYPPSIKGEDVLTFLISDHTFPRSIVYCIEHVQQAISEMEGGQVSLYSESLFRILDEVKADLEELRIQGSSMDEMIDFLNNFKQHCNQIGDIFSRTYYLVDPKVNGAYQKQT